MKRFSTLIFVLALSVGTLTPLAIFAQQEAQQAAAEVVVVPDAPAVQVQSGQAVVAPAEPPKLTEGELWANVAQAFADILQVVKKEGTSKVTIALGIILILSQLLVKFVGTPLFSKFFSKLNDAMKQAIVAICTVITTSLTMYFSGASVGAIFASSAFMTGLSFALFAIAKAWFPSLLEKLGLKIPTVA